jgi:pilus assembly protein CpaF
VSGPGGESRDQLREKYRRSFALLKTEPMEVSPSGTLPHPGLEGLDDVKKALQLLASASHLKPSSYVDPASAGETELHQIRMRLVSRFSVSDEAATIHGAASDASRGRLRAHFEPQVTKELAGTGRAFTTSEREEFLVSIVDEIVGCGPIEALLNDRSVSEIMVNKPRKIFVERNGKIELSNRRFFDEAHMMNTLSRIVSKVGRNLDLSSPHVDARLPDGSRVHAIIPPLAVDGPALTIRKFKTQTLQMEDLLAYDALTPEMAYFLGACVKARLNIVVAGGTGTGKTTFLNVLSTLVPSAQRIVTIEDAAELKVHESHPHVVRLEARPVNISGRGEVTIRDLVRDALRMRPDRIVVGECRGGEAMDMLQAMNTGHDGSMTTAHANSSAELIGRLESMCLMAGLEMPLSAIRAQIASAIELVVHLRRYPDGSRRVSDISAISGLENGAIRLQSLFRYEITGVDEDARVRGEFRVTDQPPPFLEKFAAAGLAFPSDIFGD